MSSRLKHNVLTESKKRCSTRAVQLLSNVKQLPTAASTEASFALCTSSRGVGSHNMARAVIACSFEDLALS
jgi:hypothetical protein